MVRLHENFVTLFPLKHRVQPAAQTPKLCALEKARDKTLQQLVKLGFPSLGCQLVLLASRFARFAVLRQGLNSLLRLAQPAQYSWSLCNSASLTWHLLARLVHPWRPRKRRLDASRLAASKTLQRRCEMWQVCTRMWWIQWIAGDL